MPTAHSPSQFAPSALLAGIAAPAPEPTKRAARMGAKIGGALKALRAEAPSRSFDAVRRADQRLKRETRAQTDLLRAIEIRGGEARRTLEVEGVRWEVLDEDGRVLERLPTRTAEILAERGRLRMSRFGFGGEIYQIAG